MRLFTIGYAGHTQDSLVEALSEAGVEQVVDVRANPVSRMKGFSKNRLAAVLEEAGITYRSVSELGIPTADRKAAGTSGWNDLIRSYAESLDLEQGRLGAAKALAEECNSKSTAIMCLESDLDHCHRKPLGEWIAARTGMDLHHI